MIFETRFGHDLSEIRSAAWVKTLPVSDRVEVSRPQQFLAEGESPAIVLAKELPKRF